MKICFKEQKKRKWEKNEVQDYLVITENYNRITFTTFVYVTVSIYYLNLNFLNLLLDAPLVTRFDFHSPPNKLTEYYQHFF